MGPIESTSLIVLFISSLLFGGKTCYDIWNDSYESDISGFFICIVCFLTIVIFVFIAVPTSMVARSFDTGRSISELNAEYDAIAELRKEKYNNRVIEIKKQLNEKESKDGR
jgi:hypothetical protein